MRTQDWLQLAFFLLVLIALTPLVGHLLYSLLEGHKTLLTPLLSPIEKSIYRLTGVNPSEDMTWKTYAKALLAFNIVGLIFVWLIQMSQAWLPFNPQHLPNITWHSAFNTAASFVTNTNWQGYSGETTMSYLTQMLALTVQNFVSAAVGLAVLLALIRGLFRRQTKGIGNFWVDLTRSTIYVLLPASLLYALFLVSQGVVQTLMPYVDTVGLEGARRLFRLGPSPRKLRSKCLAQMVAVFSMPMPLIHLKIPLRSPTLSKCSQF